MFLNSSIDMILLLGAGLSLVLWFRFSEGDRLSAIFRSSFFGCLLFFIGFMLYKYSGLKHQALLITASQVTMLGFASMASGLLKHLKIPVIFSAFTVLLSLFFGKSAIDGMAINKNNLSEISQDWEILVKTAEGEFPLGNDVVKAHSLTAERAFVDQNTPDHELDDYFVVNIPTKCEPAALKIKMQLEASDDFEIVEWNEVVRSEPDYADYEQVKKHRSWANDPDINRQWFYDLMQVDDVHRYLNFTNISPNRPARLFILDSGVDAKHEDLKSNYVSHKSQYDNDGNGHGTHCAGIAAAVTNNNKGVASLSPSNRYVTLTGIKVMSAFGIGTQRTIIRGILEAVEAGADVISMSLGGVSSDSKQQAYYEAFQYAYSQNAIVVVAAGNSDDEASRYTPANVPGVICVSAIDETRKKSVFSNYMDGIQMPLAAPGANIYSTMPNNKYAALSGTSMATPMVSSIVALMKSISPQLSAEEIFNILNETGLDTNSEKSTGKLIQPYEAIKMLKTTPIARSEPVFPSVLSNFHD